MLLQKIFFGGNQNQADDTNIVLVNLEIVALSESLGELRVKKEGGLS